MRWRVQLASELGELAPQAHLSVLEVGNEVRPETIRDFYENAPPSLGGPLVVTYSEAGEAEGRPKLLRWQRALQPPLWSTVFKSQLENSTDYFDLRRSLWTAPAAAPSTPSFRTVALGGTFDGCHPGHLLMLFRSVQLLDLSSLAPKSWLIGVMPQSISKEGAVWMYSYETRKAIVEACALSFLADRGWARTADGSSVLRKGDFGPVEVRVLPLDSRGLGVAELAEDLECLVVSEETRAGGDLINELRRKSGLRQLTIEVCPLVRGRGAAKVSSTETRLALTGQDCLEWTAVERELFRCALTSNGAVGGGGGEFEWVRSVEDAAAREKLEGLIKDLVEDSLVDDG